MKNGTRHNWKTFACNTIVRTDININYGKDCRGRFDPTDELQTIKLGWITHCEVKSIFLLSFSLFCVGFAGEVLIKVVFEFTCTTVQCFVSRLCGYVGWENGIRENCIGHDLYLFPEADRLYSTGHSSSIYIQNSAAHVLLLHFLRLLIPQVMPFNYNSSLHICWLSVPTWSVRYKRRPKVKVVVKRTQVWNQILVKWNKIYLTLLHRNEELTENSQRMWSIILFCLKLITDSLSIYRKKYKIWFVAPSILLPHLLYYRGNVLLNRISSV